MSEQKPTPDQELTPEFMADFFYSFVNGTPMKDGTYAHNAWCSGPRTVARGTRGVSCSCRTVRENELSDEMMKIVDLLDYTRSTFIGMSTTHKPVILAIDAVLEKYKNRRDPSAYIKELFQSPEYEQLRTQKTD